MVMTERLFNNCQNESVSTVKMTVFLRLFRKNTVETKVLKALFLYSITFILKDLSRSIPGVCTLFVMSFPLKRILLKIAVSRR
jgi:hypothetical protein